MKRRLQTFALALTAAFFAAACAEWTCKSWGSPRPINGNEPARRNSRRPIGAPVKKLEHGDRAILTLSGCRSKTLLPFQQILQEGLIEADARIHRHIIDVSLGAFGLELLSELLDRLDVIAAHALGVQREALIFFNVLEFDDPVERKVHLGLVQDVKKNDLMT